MASGAGGAGGEIRKRATARGKTQPNAVAREKDASLAIKVIQDLKGRGGEEIAVKAGMKFLKEQSRQWKSANATERNNIEKFLKSYAQSLYRLKG